MLVNCGGMQSALSVFRGKGSRSDQQLERDSRDIAEIL
jgi:hypothetical protein